MKIAVLTGGGDCPGLNAVIRAVVRRGEQHGLEIMGIREGWRGLLDPPLHDRLTRHFVIGILIAFLPAAIIGALAHDFIKTYLFESPRLICIMLIIGGVVLLVVDRMNLKPVYRDVERFPTRLYLQIGLFQTRSGCLIFACC